MVFHHGTSPTQPNPTQAPFFGVFVGIMPKWELLCVLVDPIHISTPPDGSATCRERQRGGGGIPGISEPTQWSEELRPTHSQGPPTPRSGESPFAGGIFLGSTA